MSSGQACVKRVSGVSSWCRACRAPVGFLLHQPAVEQGAYVQRTVEQSGQVDAARALPIEAQRMLQVVELFGRDVLDHLLEDVADHAMARDVQRVQTDKQIALIQGDDVKQLIFMPGGPEHDPQRVVKGIHVLEYLQTARLSVA